MSIDLKLETGPLDYLDQTCGILVAPDSREALVAGFAAGMKALAQSHQLRTKLAKPAMRAHDSTLIGSARSIKF